MILRDNGEVVSDIKDDYDNMPELEQARDGERWSMQWTSYLLRGELLVLKSRRMTWRNKGRAYSILGVISTTRYVA